MTDEDIHADKAVSASIAAEPTAPRQPIKKKLWLRRYGATLSVAIVGVLQTGHSHLFVNSNPPPRFEELQTQRIEVLAWQRLHPQLHVRLANGQDRMVEFPTLDLGARDTYYEISQDAQRQLVGKTCQMWGRPLRFSIEDHYQVFAIDCGGGNGLDFQKSLKSYTKDFEFDQFNLLKIFFFGYLFVCALTLWAETIRNRKSLQKEI